MSESPFSFSQAASGKAYVDKARMVLVAADEAVKGLPILSDQDAARASIALARRSLSNEASPADVEDSLQNEADEGILLNEQSAKSAVERSAWLAIASAIGYVAWLGYKEHGEMAGPLVSEIREDELDRLADNLRNVPGVDWDSIARSAS